MRDILKGNNKEGNLSASPPPPPPPPRKLSPFLRSILNEKADGDCISTRLLSQLTLISTNDISNKIISFRDKCQKAFQSKEPWVEESVEDEYYFDVTSYSLYRIAGELIPSDYVLRDKWVREVGREIYASMKREGIVSKDGSKDGKLTGTIPALIQILDYFQSSGFIKGYRLGEKNDDVRTGTNIFDEYDDEDVDSGTSVNLLLSIFRPATLGSSLQITGEGSRFSADFISPTIAALWEDQLGGKLSKIEFEGYFVDEEYRPNPKDFFPDEQLLQFTLSPSKKK